MSPVKKASPAIAVLACVSCGAAVGAAVGAGGGHIYGQSQKKKGK